MVYVFLRSGKNVACQNDRHDKKVTGQQAFLAGHCPLTGRYFEPCICTLCRKLEELRKKTQEEIDSLTFQLEVILHF